MSDAIKSLIKDAKKQRCSFVDNHMDDEDIMQVWNCVSDFILKQMKLTKGVCINGLGTFTFNQKRSETSSGQGQGRSEFSIVQRPVFVISEKFVNKHNFRSSKTHTSANIPVVQLNCSAVAMETRFDRDTVDLCIREVIQALDRSVSQGRSVEFVFTGLGRLQIRNSKVKMRFYKEFVNGMDSSGMGSLMALMKDRPGTADSVMSDRPPTRPFSNNTVLLPSLHQSGYGGPVMPTITEQEPDHDLKIPEGENPRVLGEQVSVAGGDEQVDQQAMITLNDLTPEPEIRNLTSSCSAAAGRACVQLPRAMGVSFADDIVNSELDSPKMIPINRGASASMNRVALSPPGSANSNLSKSFPQFSCNYKLSPNGENLLTTDLNRGDPGRPHSTVSGKSNNSSRLWKLTPLENIKPDQGSICGSIAKDPFANTDKPDVNGTDYDIIPPGSVKEVTSRPESSNCGHANAGQELCYLCHQRAARNIPVYLTEARAAKEKEDDRLLQNYQRLVDANAINTEKKRNEERRDDGKKMAAFNLGVAEAVTCRKNIIDPYHNSYIFRKRPITPPKQFKQDKYSKDLEGQVDDKMEVFKKKKSEEDFLGRLEQVQLAEDLACQRDQYVKQKYEQQNMYKKALAEQLKFKPLPLPARVPDSTEPVFGKLDACNDILAARKKRAEEVFKEQLETVERRKRQKLLERLTELKHDDELINRNKDEMREERFNRYDLVNKQRHALVEDWREAGELKRARDLQRRHEEFSRTGALLHEQCDKYKRCNQCKRKSNNCGETNLWKESRYIAGSRLIV